MRTRRIAMKIGFWFFTLWFGVLPAIAFWFDLKTTFERAVLLWLTGYGPLLGGITAHVVAGKYKETWEDLLKPMYHLIMGWLFGVLLWVIGYQYYREAMEYLDWKEYYEERGIRKEEWIRKESFWEYLKR